MKAFLRSRLKPGSFWRWVLRGLWSSPIAFSIALLRSVIATWRMTGRPYPVMVRLGIAQRFHVEVDRMSRIHLGGILAVNSWGGSRAPSSLGCRGGRLNILGDFELGSGVHLSVASGATLTIGGCVAETASGITCDSRVMVSQNVTIGADTIIAWGVFISDDDWHEIDGVRRVESVAIGRHVWIAHDVSIAPGARIGDGSIIGAKSLVLRGEYPERSLLAGIPAQVVRRNVEWTR